MQINDNIKNKINKTKKYELLAPAGSFENLIVAINAGADAVYFGIQGFNMRANARNFTLKDLPKIKKICETTIPGKKVKRYLTVNIIVYNEELKKVEEVIKKAKKYVDAIICWDMAVINLCRKHKVPFHISTQASVSNIEAAKFYKSLGAERIVLARELNLKQIEKISNTIDVETFVHGAMCVSISGRCFTSQFLFNKSANRGECIQPCRRSYEVYKIKDKQEGFELKLENDKVMSAKDLCTLPFIDKLKKANIKAFKIEGRNRDPRYVDTVVRVYRKALDSKRPLTSEQIKEMLKELQEVYNKGFSSGFYLGVPTSDDFSKVEHSSATKSKRFVAKILKYYPKINVALIRVSSNFDINDEICIIGKKIGIIHAKIESMEKNKVFIKKAEKGEELGIKFDFNDSSKSTKIGKNDDVYVIYDK